jgi:predicted transposase YdaD
LRQTGSALVQQETFIAAHTQHRYQVLRLWEQDPTPLLAEPGLLPFATLAKAEQPETLLRQVAQQVDKIEPVAQRRSVATGCFILSGLRFERTITRALFREELMQESVTYQYLVQKGLQEGIQQGIQQESTLLCCVN